MWRNPKRKLRQILLCAMSIQETGVTQTLNLFSILRILSLQNLFISVLDHVLALLVWL